MIQRDHFNFSNYDATRTTTNNGEHEKMTKTIAFSNEENENIEQNLQTWSSQGSIEDHPLKLWADKMIPTISQSERKANYNRDVKRIHN